MTGLRLTHPVGRRDDSGSTLIEFIVVVTIVMIPLVYLVLGVGRVQSAAYAATAAVKEAGRAYVTADNPGEGADRAQVAAALSLGDHGINLPPGVLDVQCIGPCLSRGSSVRITLDLNVGLPFVPDRFLDTGAGFPVRASHVATVDRYR